MKLTKAQVMDRIEQLNKDRLLFAVESVAVSILALLVFIGAPSVFPTLINPYDPNSLKILQAVIALPTAFWVYVIVGNMVRMYQVLKLQEKLHGKKK